LQKKCDLTDETPRFDSLNLESHNDTIKLKLIDFANVFTPPSNSLPPLSDPHSIATAPDEDLMLGIQKIIGLLEEMLRTPHLLDDYDLDTETSASGKK
jgi:hypothetical protein